MGTAVEILASSDNRSWVEVGGSEERPPPLPVTTVRAASEEPSGELLRRLEAFDSDSSEDDDDDEEEEGGLRRRSNSDPQGIARAIRSLTSPTNKGETDSEASEAILGAEGRASRSRLKASASTDGLSHRPVSGEPGTSAGKAAAAASRSHQHRKRALSQTLRRSKFWLRLLQPWKWRRRKGPRTSASFSVSAGGQEGQGLHSALLQEDESSGGALSSSATFPPPHPSSASAPELEAEEGSEETPERTEDESTMKARGGRCVVVVAPSEEPVTLVRASTSTGSQVERVRLAPAPVPPPKPTTSSGEAETSEEQPFSRRATVDSALEVSPTLSPPPPYPHSPPDSPGQSSLAQAPNVERVPAREPDLNAVPAKPALRQTATAGAYAHIKRRQHSSSSSPRDSDASDDDDSDEVNTRSEEAEALADRMEGSNLTSNGHSPQPPREAGDEEEEEDEEIPATGLAAKIVRKDTLALRNLLSDEAAEGGGEDSQAEETRREAEEEELQSPKEKMRQASIKLERRLSQRPTASELESRDILRGSDSAETRKASMEARRKMLLRKLSFRPTIEELQERQIISFNDYVEVTQAEAYDRKADKPWTKLTPQDKASIRKELNDFKSCEMQVHEESRQFTRFHRP